MSINDRARLNLILGTAAFIISAGGSVLLQIVFATTIYKETGSSLLTSLFISLQWLPVLAVLAFKSDWEDGVDPRQRWLKLELIAAALTCPILFFVDQPNYYILFILLFMRGIADHIARIIKTVSARYIFPEDKTTRYAPILQAGFHVGICSAAIVGVVLGQNFTRRTATLIDICSFLTAAVLVFFIKTINQPEPAPRRRPDSLATRVVKYRSVLLSDQRLFFSALLPPLTATFFQGTYSVFQPLFPLRVLRLDADAVAIAYVLASVGILAGSSCFAYMNNRFDFYKRDYPRTKRIIFSLSCISSAAYLAAAASGNPLLCAAFFTLMVFTFEVVWMFGYAGIVAYAPKGELGSVFGITFGIGCCGASLFVVLAGALLDSLNGNFPLVIALFMAAYLLILLGGHYVYRRLHPAAAELSLS